MRILLVRGRGCMRQFSRISRSTESFFASTGRVESRATYDGDDVMSRRKKRTTTDALEIIHRRYYANRPRRLADLHEAIANDDVARKIQRLRTRAGLTQRQLAK